MLLFKHLQVQITIRGSIVRGVKSTPPCRILLIRGIRKGAFTYDVSSRGGGVFEMLAVADKGGSGSKSFEGGRSMLTGGKICQNLADVICGRYLSYIYMVARTIIINFKAVECRNKLCCC